MGIGFSGTGCITGPRNSTIMALKYLILIRVAAGSLKPERQVWRAFVNSLLCALQGLFAYRILAPQVEMPTSDG